MCRSPAVLRVEHKDTMSKPRKPKWNTKTKPRHTPDQRLVEIVRFLARRAAERDYKAQQGKSTEGMQ